MNVAQRDHKNAVSWIEGEIENMIRDLGQAECQLSCYIVRHPGLHAARYRRQRTSLLPGAHRQDLRQLQRLYRFRCLTAPPHDNTFNAAPSAARNRHVHKS